MKQNIREQFTPENSGALVERSGAVRESAGLAAARMSGWTEVVVAVDGRWEVVNK
jgi:hypothetical protein